MYRFKLKIMWILIIILIAVGALIFLLTKINRRNSTQEPEITIENNEECCGAHEVCDKDSLLNNSCDIIYYEDEELDTLSGKPVSNYSETDIKQLSEVFFTLKEQDVAGWLKSLQLRNIELPLEIRDQALMIVGERRSEK